MTRRIRSAAAVAAVVACLAPTSQAEDLKGTFKVLYSRIGAAIVKGDHDTVGQMLAPSFVYWGPEGKQNRSQFLASMKRDQLGGMTISTLRFHIAPLAPEGYKVPLNVQGRMVGSLKDPQGKKHSLSRVASYRDTWMKTASGWKALYHTVVKQRSMIDGKRFDPSKLAPSPKPARRADTEPTSVRRWARPSSRGTPRSRWVGW